MVTIRKIKVNKKFIQAVSIKLGLKKLIVLSGKKGYVMCGYLNLTAANKFKDRAVVVTGVSTIKEALLGKAAAVSEEAKKVGIKKGQAIKDVIKVIA